MFGVGLLIIVLAAVVALFIGGFYWARQRGLLTGEPAAEGEQGKRHISLLTEAVGYVGIVLLLAAGVAAVGQRWDSISNWWRVAILAAAAVFFLVVGIVLRRVSEPAIQRLVGVTWFLSAIGVAGAVEFAAQEVAYGNRGNPGAVTILIVGVAGTLYAAALWLVRRGALQDTAMFAGLVMTVCGTIATVQGEGAAGKALLPYALALWGLGIAWAWAGWRRYIEPVWVTMGLGVMLALIAPSLGLHNGWMYAIAVGTAAAAMAASVPLRNTPLLGLGTLAMFGYVTSAVVRYFRESLGIPGALAITGVLIIGLAVLTARLLHETRPPKPTEPGTEPSPLTRPPKPTEPGTEEPAHRDLPKAS